MAKLGSFLKVLALISSLLAVRCAGDTNSTGQIPCNTVKMRLAPCLAFITDRADKPSSMCCSGAKTMAETAKTKEDRQEICLCVKDAIKGMDKVDYAKINQIPKECGLNVALPPINKETDCKSINPGGSVW